MLTPAELPRHLDVRRTIELDDTRDARAVLAAAIRGPILKSVCHGSVARRARRSPSRADRTRAGARCSAARDDRGLPRPGSGRGTPASMSSRRPGDTKNGAASCACQSASIDGAPAALSSARSVSRCGYTRAHGRCSCAAPISIRRDASWRGVFLEARRTRSKNSLTRTGSRLKHGGDAVGGVAVPQLGHSLRRRRRERLLDAGNDVRGLRADDAIGAVGDRDRPLGVLAQREAGNAERGRLLLQAAGVGEDQARVRRQREKVDVAERLGQDDAVEPALEAELAQAVARARVHGKDDRHPARTTWRTRVQDAAERLAIVHVRRPVQRQDGVRARRRPACDRGCDRASQSAGDGAACRSSRCRRNESAPPACPRRAGSRRRRATASAADPRAGR